MIFPRFAYSIFSNIEFSLSSNNETHNYLSKLKVKIRTLLEILN